MAHQIQLADSALADLPSNPDRHSNAVAEDLAYLRLAMVNVILYGKRGAGDRQWTLIDTGVTGLTDQIVAAAAERFGANARPAAIILTHGHFDHTGSLEALAEQWETTIYAHSLEAPYLNGSAAYPPPDAWVGGGIMPLLAPLFPRSPLDVSARLQMLPADGSVPGMPGWQWVHTPGHSPGHVSLWREADRAVIAGDAFITTNQEGAYAVAVQALEMHGPPMYFTPDWAAAENSVWKLSDLQPELAITGHGKAVRGAAFRESLARLASDFATVAVPKDGKYVQQPARAEDGTAYEPATTER